MHNTHRTLRRMDYNNRHKDNISRKPKLGKILVAELPVVNYPV